MGYGFNFHILNNKDQGSRLSFETVLLSALSCVAFLGCYGLFSNDHSEPVCCCCYL